MASRSLSKAEAFIKETGLEGLAVAYGCYEQLLSDPKAEAVYIPLPAGIRLEWVQKAAKAGKHVLSEKPIALVSLGLDAAAQMSVCVWPCLNRKPTTWGGCIFPYAPFV